MQPDCFWVNPFGRAFSLITKSDLILAAGNVIDGGEGRDIYVGGGGADVFVFGNLGPTSYYETAAILDFEAGRDRIEIDADLLGAEAGPLDRAMVAFGTEAQDADDRLLVDRASGEVWLDADGAGGADAVLFARIIEESDMPLWGDVLLV